MSQYICLSELEYVPISGADEEVVPSNIHALKKGLEALLSEDARDNLRAAQLWAEAEALLSIQRERETGAGASGSMQVADDFFMSSIGWGYGIGYGVEVW